MAKKDNTPAISFFSFQDIITSITGIMFLVVMMLVLMILNRPDSSTPAEKQNSADLRQLTEELQMLEESLKQVRKQNELLQQRVAELKKIKLETLAELKNALVIQLQGIDAGIKDAAEEEKKLLWQLEQESAAAAKNAAALLHVTSENKKLGQQIKQLDVLMLQQTKQSQQLQRILRMAWNQGNQKRPLFLECSDKGIWAGTPLEPDKVKNFKDLDECVTWCRDFPTDEVCFILLIKPSAFGYGEKLSRELQKAGYERGREILPDEKNLLAGGEGEK